MFPVEQLKRTNSASSLSSCSDSMNTTTDASTASTTGFSNKCAAEKHHDDDTLEVHTQQQQLNEASNIIQTQALALQALQTELCDLRRSARELECENEELANDMQDQITEGEEAEDQLNAARDEIELLHKETVWLRQQRDCLTEQLERIREQEEAEEQTGQQTYCGDRVEMGEVVQHLQDQMRRRLREAACEQSTLEEDVLKLRRERDAMQEAVEVIMSVKHEMDEKLEDVNGEVHEIKRFARRLSLTNAALEEQLAGKDENDEGSEAYSDEMEVTPEMLEMLVDTHRRLPEHHCEPRSCFDTIWTIVDSFLISILEESD